MIAVYLPSETPATEAQAIAQAVGAAGYDPRSIRRGRSLAEFVRTLPVGSTAVVHSIGFLASVDELLEVLWLLKQRNAALRSISEPWLVGAALEHGDLIEKLCEFSKNKSSKPTP